MTLSNFLLDAISSSSRDSLLSLLSYGAVGTGSSPPSASDTALDSEVFRSARANHSNFSDRVVVGLFVTSVDANGSLLSEVGWFDASSGGNLLFRELFTNSVNKDSSIELWVDTEVVVSVSEVVS